MSKTIQELQTSIIKNCNFIYNKYADMPVMDWDAFWRTSQAMQDKYINEDDFIQEFVTFRMGIVLKDLGVVRGGKTWPLRR